MKTRIQLFLIVLTLLVGACGSDPAIDGVKLKMKAVTSLSTINGRTSAMGLEFTQILVGVRELEFETLDEDELEEANDIADGETGDGENENEEIEFEGEYIVDLINGTSTPDFGTAEVFPGTYEEIEIELGPILEGGKTVIIAFTSNSIQYEFSTTEEIELEIEGAAGYQLDAGALTNLLVLLDLDTLFGSVDLSVATADGDGVVRINNSSNSEIHNQLLSALENSCDAGEDDDHDDDID